MSALNENYYTIDSDSCIHDDACLHLIKNINECTFKYLSHGGRHIVFEICNYRQYVLRCSRASLNTKHNNNIYENKLPSSLRNYVGFSRNIFENLLGTTKYSTLLPNSRNSIITINSDTLKRLNHLISNLGNISISSSDVSIELNAHYSKDIDDFLEQQSRVGKKQYCRFSVEIKPKSGILPTSMYISEKNQIKKKKSIYQLQQFLKLKTKKIKKISKYDPIDLFNVENKACVKKAIKSLSKNPQNNMKLFSCNNSLAKTIHSNFMEYFKSMNINNYENIVNHLTDILTNKQSRHLLNQIRSIQSMDDYDIEGLTKLKLSSFALNENNASNFDIHNLLNDVNKSGVNKIFGCSTQSINPNVKKTKDGNNCNILTTTNPSTVIASLKNNFSDADKIQTIRRFLLSKTAKDLSIIITTLYPLDSNNEKYVPGETMDSSDIIPPYGIKVIDTDFKPISKFKEWIGRDLDIMEAYHCYQQKT
jgi:hypothetical protein